MITSLVTRDTKRHKMSKIRTRPYEPTIFSLQTNVQRFLEEIWNSSRLLCSGWGLFIFHPENCSTYFCKQRGCIIKISNRWIKQNRIYLVLRGFSILCYKINLYLKKELNLRQKFKFSNPYIISIFDILNFFWYNRINSMKYLRSPTLGCLKI